MAPKNSELTQSQKKKIHETSAAGTPGQSQKKKPEKKQYSALLSLLVVSLLFGGSIFYFFQGSPKTTEVPISEFVQSYKGGKYETIEIRDHTIIGTLAWTESPTPLPSFDFAGISQTTSPTKETATLPAQDSLKDIGIDIDAPLHTVKIQDTTSMHFWADLAPTLIWTVLFLALFILLMGRMMSGSGGGPMGFVKNKAKRYEPAKGKILFTDVAWSVEEKQDLQEFVDFLKNPNKYKKLWAKIPRGVLMVGPPGTGKTLLARAVAGESNVPFYSISGSEFVEMFVGVGAARVRDLFAEAKAHAPAIIFIDEIDAIGKKRSTGFGGGHDEREQTLNQILTEMDGFDNDTNIIIMGATNRADVLDRALLRPGRFDRKVTIHLPNLEDRIAILEVHARNKPMAKDVNFRKVASSTIGFSGADLENLLNEAAILAGRENAHEITQHMLQVSIEKIVMGNTKKSHVMTEFEQKLTAYHEVGHALVGKMTKHSDPVHKISIISRGSAGGVTWFLPEKDRTYITKAKMLDELAVFFGGRAAEEIFFGSEYITTGASSDIERATDIARDMVTRFGFDSEIGMENIAWRIADGNYLGVTEEGSPISDETKHLVDIKVRKLLTEAYERAKKIINTNKELHEKISQVLMKKQEMLQEEFDVFFDGVKVPEKILL
jgi:cell division protease FtsH